MRGCRNKAKDGDGRDEKRRKMRSTRRTVRDCCKKMFVFI